MSQEQTRQYIIIDLDHPKILGQAIVSEILKDVPHVRLSELQNHFDTTEKELNIIASELIKWQKK